MTRVFPVLVKGLRFMIDAETFQRVPRVGLHVVDTLLVHTSLEQAILKPAVIANNIATCCKPAEDKTIFNLSQIMTDRK